MRYVILVLVLLFPNHAVAIEHIASVAKNGHIIVSQNRWYNRIKVKGVRLLQHPAIPGLSVSTGGPADAKVKIKASSSRLRFQFKWSF